MPVCLIAFADNIKPKNKNNFEKQIDRRYRGNIA
jgi:hypothetical protein